MSTRWHATCYSTDKISNQFMPHYERVLGGLRDQPVRLLELGVAEGGSCLLWNDFFKHPQSTIIGVDINLPAHLTGIERSKIILESCDQNDTNHLGSIADRYGLFDVIIDDASHKYHETLSSFHTLLPHLKPGGFYVIEDWAVGYFDEVHHVFGDSEGNTMVTLITNLVNNAPDLGLRGIDLWFDDYKSIVFFEKQLPDTPKPRFEI